LWRLCNASIRPNPPAGIDPRIEETWFSAALSPVEKHEFMVREADQLRLFVPNPHKGEISRPLLGEILREAGIFPGGMGTPLTELLHG